MKGSEPGTLRRALAEKKAFKYLEQRWKSELKGRKIPGAHRRKMRQNPAFQKIVNAILDGDGIAALDMEATPVVERNPDGSVTNRMEEELGGDPRAYFCLECGREKDEAGREPCPSCVKFHQRLYDDAP